ncbi:MAG: acyltransferase [Oscillospiraceae bacterium]|nr:acyltransferase [Oscillospiraceae bacterium]
MSEAQKTDRYSYGLDLLRLLCTAAVLVYHIDPARIPGGYLAVCSFLVLHGYLFVFSFLKKDNPSLLRHYGKRFFRLYIPMFITVALTVLAFRFTPDILWLNEKPETMSVLYGCNNWWQIQAGQDYFTRLTASPFTHMWYLSLLLQEELLLPILCLGWNALKNRFGFFLVWIPFLIQAAAAAMILPRFCSLGYPEMRTYYGTDARIFSTLFGMALAFLHREGHRLTLPFLKKGTLSVLLLLGSLTALAYAFLRISPDTSLFPYGFLIASLITIPVISLATNEEYALFSQLRSPLLRHLSSITFEVYLVHYPLLFFAQSLSTLDGIHLPLYIGLVLAVSVVLHFALSIRSRKDRKTVLPDLLKLALLIPILYAVFLGVMDIRAAEDHTQEMAALQAQLEENAKLMEELQKVYAQKQSEETDSLSDPLSFAEEVDAAHLHVTGIGDSVMLGAIRNLYETFPNGDFDAQQNRSHYPVMTIARDRNADGTLGNPVIIGIGTNNTLPIEDLRTIVSLCGERDIFWITTTNDWQFKNNDTIRSLGEEFENVTVIDWEERSKEHGEFFYSDGIHLTTEGRRAYADLILNSIEELYGSKLSEQRKQEQIESRILGIGGSWLMTGAADIQNALGNCVVLASEEPNAETILQNIQIMRENGLLPKKVFIAIGNADNDQKLLRDLLPGLDDCNVVLYLLSSKAADLAKNYPDKTVLFWDISYQDHPQYYLADRVHLSQEGTEALISRLLSGIQEIWDIPKTE